MSIITGDYDTCELCKRRRTKDYHTELPKDIALCSNHKGATRVFIQTWLEVMR